MKISNARCNIGISDPCNVPSISHICEVWIQPKTDAGAKTTRASPTAPLPLPLQFGSCSSYPFFPATRPSLCQSNRAPQANVSPAYQHHESHLIWIDGGWLRCLLAPDGLRLGPNVPDLPRPSRPSTGGRDATAWCSPPGTPSHATAVWSQSSSTLPDAFVQVISALATPRLRLPARCSTICQKSIFVSSFLAR
jgi:hypothetical protein